MKNHRHTIAGLHNRHVRVLVADDNLVNQHVAIAILEKLGYRADVVANGKEALTALKAALYDLVFMDCQMPEIDGYEATRQIRNWGKETGNLKLETRNSKLETGEELEGQVTSHKSQVSSIPIIAMTANAMKGDREKCLAAGMNDYIAKPVSPGAIAEALNRWLCDPTDKSFDKRNPLNPKSNGETPKVPIDPDKSEQVPAPPEQGPVVFDRIAFVERLMGDKDLAKTVIEGFLEDIPKQMAGFKVPIDQGDAEKAGAQAHKIKGAAANVGGLAMSAVAYEMENAGKRGDLDRLTAMMPVLEKEFERLQQAMGGE